MAVYPTVGRCIYCEAICYSEKDPTHKLGDEHIIPQSIGGDLLLKEASCQVCERITSGLEDHCVKGLFGQALPHYGIKSRGSKRLAKNINYSVEGQLQKKKIPLNVHPGMLFGFILNLPCLILGVSPTKEYAAGSVGVSLAVKDFNDRVDKLPGGKMNFKTDMKVDIFIRMLAKIAHSYAVAEKGLLGFSPFLQALILGNAPEEHLSFFVGGEVFVDPASNVLHEVSSYPLAMNGKNYLIVKIRLFANKGMPTYLVVAGEY